MERYRIVGLFFLLKKLNLNKKIKRIKKKNSGDVENCGSFKSFGFIYIYIYIDYI